MNVRWLLENPVLTWKDTKVSGKFHLTNFEADREVADLEAFGMGIHLVLSNKNLIQLQNLQRKIDMLRMNMYWQVLSREGFSWIKLFFQKNSMMKKMSLHTGEFGLPAYSGAVVKWLGEAC